MSDGHDPTSVLMNHLSESLSQVHKEIKSLHSAVNYYRATQDEGIERAIDKAMLKAFPQGDAEGHKRAHEAEIKAAEAKEKMYSELRMSVAKWGLAGLLGWAAISLWQAFLLGPK